MRSSFRMIGVLFVLGALIGVGARRAHAVDPSAAARAKSTYVAPAYSAPKAPLTCGEDGGAACQLTFTAGSCLRIAPQGTWKYQVGAFETFPDGGSVINLATGALYTLPDGGAATYSDGGTETDGGPALGAVIPYPRLNPLTDDKVEGWCLTSYQSIISAVTVDGGKFTAAERF